MRLLLPALLLLSTLAAAIPAAAQVDPQLTLTATPSSLPLGPDETDVIELSFTNDGPTAGDVELTLPTLSGWTFTADQTQFALSNGNPVTVRVTVDAVPTETANPVNGSAVFSATISHATTGRGNSAQDSVTMTYDAPAAAVPSAPPLAPDYTVAIILGIAGALLLVGVAVYLGQASQVRIRVEKPNLTITSGTDGVYNVLVENRAGSPREVQVRVREAPVGWHAAFSFPILQLQGKETTSVPLYVKVPPAAPEGSLGRLRLQARPNGFSPWMTGTDVTAEIVGVKGPSRRGPTVVETASNPI